MSTSFKKFTKKAELISLTLDQMLASDTFNGLLITGEPGSGSLYLLKQQLEEKQLQYVAPDSFLWSRTGPKQFEFLDQHNNKVIIVDVASMPDFDMRYVVAIQYLKTACDNTQKRIIRIETKTEDDSFKFVGKIIFNCRHASDIPSVLSSRCHILEF